MARYRFQAGRWDIGVIQILIGLGMLLIFSYLKPIVSRLPVSVISNNT